MSKYENPDRHRFHIRYEIDLVLNLDEIWPDGDAPENPTIEDVYKAMGNKDGTPPTNTSALDIIHDWNLDDGTQIEVRPVQTRDQA